MNEVTNIHLGRQVFTISAEAHHELKVYLDAIQHRISDDSVLEEVELRMAELLQERGVYDDKVILPADVTYIKEQLGDPKDFAEDDTGAERTTDRSADAKRLFRDTDNAMLAGVAAGLATYFGIDVLLVRLLFVVAAFTGGWGILLYLVLWLLVPEAKTSSERLQMVGKPVTVETLKEVAARADVKGAAQRANNSLAGVVNAVFEIILKLVGAVLVAAGIGLLLSLIGAATYVFLRGGNLLQYSIFPIGLREHLVVYIAAAIGMLIALFIVLIGLAVFRRKWPIHTWITGVLAGLLLIGLTVGGALTADIAPQVRDRYNAGLHSTVHTVPPFTAFNADSVGEDVSVAYRTANTYSVSFRYFGHPDLSMIQTRVSNGVLSINTHGFNGHRDCHGELCLPNDYSLVITITSPTPPQVNNADGLSAPTLPVTPQLQ